MVLGSRIRDPGSEIRDPRSGIRKKLIPDPGSRGQKSTDPGSRIRIRNTAPQNFLLCDLSMFLNADYSLAAEKMGEN